MTPQEHQQLVKANIYGSYTNPNELVKGGEGSRGGKVIGHTKSGKPIYDTHDHPAHTSFDKNDHHEAWSHNENRVADLLKKRGKAKNEDTKNSLMDEAVTAEKNAGKHWDNYNKPDEAAPEEEDDDDEEVYQRKQKEKREKESGGKFFPDDMLTMHSPHTNQPVKVSFRGYMDGGKAVVFDKVSGNQFTVPSEWLKK